MGEIKSYRDLMVWQRAVSFAVDIYQTTAAFPKSEVYGLTSQMRRAAVSIASNIAEGHARPGREFGRFLGMSIGSLAELETQMEIACRVGYLTEHDFTTLSNELTIIGKQLKTLSQRIR
jgi:four helix bundle protein